MLVSMEEALNYADSMAGANEPITSLRVGEMVTLTHLVTRNDLNGRKARLDRLGDDGRAQCVVALVGCGANERVNVKLCNLAYPATEIDVTDRMHRAFPELRKVLALATPTRIERPIVCLIDDTEVACVASAAPVGASRPNSLNAHRLGATVDVTATHLVLTLWTLLDDRVVASRVGSLERRSDRRSEDDRLHVGATFINMWDYWRHDCATWIEGWLKERLGEKVEEEDEEAE
jgi:hypothetical protein